MQKYDDLDWHAGDFDGGLEDIAGGTHIGMFLTWAILRGLGADDLSSRVKPVLEARRMTPGELCWETCDGALLSVWFGDEGNAFTQGYYTRDDQLYFRDYAAWLAKDLPSIYHVPDTWETFDLLAPKLDERLAFWRNWRASQQAED